MTTTNKVPSTSRLADSYSYIITDNAISCIEKAGALGDIAYHLAPRRTAAQLVDLLAAAAVDNPKIGNYEIAVGSQRVGQVQLPAVEATPPPAKATRVRKAAAAS